MQIENGDGNTIVGAPAQDAGTRVFFKSTGNTLQFGENVKLRNTKFVFLGKPSRIIIDDDVTINSSAEFWIQDGSVIHFKRGISVLKESRFHAAEATTIEIGEDCLFANVRLRTSDQHNVITRDTRERINPAKDIVVKERVWLAEFVSIYKGVTIGEGSVVGAASVVTKNLPAYTLSAGVPAKVVKENVTWEG